MKKLKTSYWIIALSIVTGILIQPHIGLTNNSRENAMDIKTEIATFAGGCFWCVESAFEGLDGVLDVISGHTGGHTDHPDYKQVTSGTTGHFEAIQIKFDPDIISFQGLLKVFFQQIDPTDSGGSFVDRGSQYRSAIFFHNKDQKREAQKIIERINHSKLFDKAVATQILTFKRFYDGPAPTGLRYCINSASLRFIPKENLEKEGFTDLLHLFE